MADLTLSAIKERLDFWKKLKGKSDVDDLIYKLIGQNFYRANPERRKKQIVVLEKQITALYKSKYIPLALEMGSRHARQFIKRLADKGLKVSISRTARDAIFKQYKKNVKGQYDAFRHALRNEANHKLAEVEVFFDQGQALGRTKRDISAQLQEIHLREKKAVRLAQAAGKSPRSVRSFAARFDVAVKGVMRDNFRRSAQSAEFNEYKKAGFGTKGFVWIAANGGKACPDCNAYHGVMKMEKDWHTRPGDGTTICGAACQCMLEPTEYVEGNTSLASPLNYKKPVNLSQGDIRSLDRNRIDPATVRTGEIETHKAKQPRKG